MRTPHDDRAMAVAYYRARKLIDSHSHDAVELERRSREMLARMKANHR